MVNDKKKTPVKNDEKKIKKTGFDQLNSRWSNKFDLNKMYDINPEEEKAKQQMEYQAKQEECKKKKTSNYNENELIEIQNNCKNKKQILDKIAWGAFSGATFVLPTLGVGSILFANQKQKYVNQIKQSFYSKSIKIWGWNLLSILPMFLMWIFTFIISYAIFASVCNVEYGPALYFLGIGFSISLIPLLMLLNEHTIPFSQSSFDEIKKNQPKWKWGIIIGSFSFLLIIAFGLIIRFAWDNGNNQNLLFISGYSTLSNKALIELGISKDITQNTIESLSNTQNIIILFLGAIFSGFFVLIPGLSAGFGFALMGDYRLINSALYSSFLNQDISWFTPNEAWPLVIISMIGYIFGFIAAIYLMSYLLNNHQRLTFTIFIFLMIGSIIASFIALSELDYQWLSTHPILLGISIMCLVVGSLVTLPKLILNLKKRQKNLSKPNNY